jgi:hypothetical protein
MTEDAQTEVARPFTLVSPHLGREFRHHDGAAPNWSASDGEFQLDVHVRSIVPVENPNWERPRQLLEELIGDDLPVRVALWVPAGATLPSEEPAISEFVSLVRQAGVRLGPGERSHVALPITLRLRKSSDSGGVVSVTGGLNPHWATFTDRVRGSFDMDSTDLYRLPESQEHLEKLTDFIVERANSMEIGDVSLIETADCWTIQRLDGEHGLTIVGIPPAAAVDMGLAVRRGFRRILNEGGPPLRASTSDLKALVVVAQYPRMEQEGATTAMRGYDPSSYSGIDFVCLVSDGLVKPLVQPPDNALPWNRRADRA